MYEKRNDQITKDLYYSQLYHAYVQGAITRDDYIRTMAIYFKGKKV